jgi:uncharacterized membrane protein YbhN (UPF0104 family)
MRLRIGLRGARRVLGLVLTVAVFAVLFRYLSAEDLVAAVQRIEPIWVLPLLALIALGELTRALKWRLILAPIRRVGVLRLYGAIMIGYLANLIIPLRVSPLVRAYVVQVKEAVPTSTVLATVAVDRLADGLVSVGLLAAVLVVMPLPDSLVEVRAALVAAGWVLLGVYAAVVVLLTLAARAPCAGGRIWLGLGRPLPRRWRAWLVGAGRRFARGLVIPGSGWARLGVVLFALAHKVTQVWQIQAAARAFDLGLGFAAGLLLVLFLGAAVIAAGTLGIRGGYYIATAVGLGWFGVAEETGLAMGMLMGGASLLTVALLGLAFVWVEGIGLQELRAWAKQGNGSDGVDGTAQRSDSAVPQGAIRDRSSLL